MTTNPFGTAIPKAPTAAPVTPVPPVGNITTPPTATPVSSIPASAVSPMPNEVPPMSDAPVGPTVSTATTEKVKKPRKHPNRQMTVEERKYVIENYATKNTNEIANELGLTRQQVYRTVNEARKNLQKRIQALQETPDTPERQAQVDRIQVWLDKLPTKPAGSGTRAGSGGRQNTVDFVLDELINL